MIVNQIVNEYKNNLEKDLKQLELNKKIDNFMLSLENQDTFNQINNDEFIELLSKTNYQKELIPSVLNTIKYIQINDSLNLEIKEFLQSIFVNLLILKKDVKQEFEIKELLEKTNSLIETINNPNLYVKNIEFLFHIFDDLKVDMEQIIKFVKEVDVHNDQVLKNKIEKNRENNPDKEEIEIINVVDNNKNKINLNNLVKENNDLFTSLEKELLRNEYVLNTSSIGEKLNYIYETFELSFIKNNLKKYKKLLVVLLVFSDINIIKDIVDICKNNQIKISNLAPTFFISNKSNHDFSLYEDEFYQNLSSSYESLKEVLKIFSNSINPSKLISEYSTVCMTNYDLLMSNIKTLKTYKIPLSTFSIRGLTLSDLISRIDRFIEFGLYEYIKNVPTIILNQDDAFFHRIYYAKKNNIQIKRRFLNKDITDIDGLGINRKNYKEKVRVYKPNYFNLKFYDKLLTKKQEQDNLSKNIIEELLSEYLVNEYTYQINNTLFSKLKVIRLYNNYLEEMKKLENKNFITDIKGIIFSFISDVILDYDETRKIILELLKISIKYYGLNDENIEILCENFAIKYEDKSSLLNYSKRNGVN